MPKYHDLEAGLVLLSALSGVDWSQYGVDRPIEQFDTDASRSILAAVDGAGDRHRITLRDYVGGLGGFGGQLFVGSARTVADELEAYAESTGIDGFNITYHVTPGSFADVGEHLIPELRRRGRAREAGDATDAAGAGVRRGGAAARRPPRRGFPGPAGRSEATGGCSGGQGEATGECSGIQKESRRSDS